MSIEGEASPKEEATQSSTQDMDGTVIVLAIYGHLTVEMPGLAGHVKF